jgi:uncharacterized protein YbjT (DUF2867 family)
MTTSGPVTTTSLEPILLFGASGLVGTELLELAAAVARPVLAVSRAIGAPEASGVRWFQGAGFDLYAGDGPWPETATLVSSGPLDALAAWLERVRPPSLRRLVALSSTSVETKIASTDSAERALVAQLARAESRVIEYCLAHDVRWTLLRPTLIWGRGRDRNVSRLAAMARRVGFIALPAFASGLRQPIRARDVAASLLAATGRAASENRRLDLPGGEILAYDEMARRIAAAVSPNGRIVRLPGVLVSACTKSLSMLGLAGRARAAIERMHVPLVFDGGPAREALGIEPDGFAPAPGDFSDQ